MVYLYSTICFPSCKSELAQVTWDHIFQFRPTTCWYKWLITFTEHMSINLFDLFHVWIHFFSQPFQILGTNSLSSTNRSTLSSPATPHLTNTPLWPTKFRTKTSSMRVKSILIPWLANSQQKTKILCTKNYFTTLNCIIKHST